MQDANTPSIAQFEIGSAQNLVYLVLDWATRTAAWVDPQQDLTEPLRVLNEQGFTLTHVLLTHNHWDHVAGLAEVVERFPTISVCVHQKDASVVHKKIPHHPMTLVEDSEIIHLGNTPIQILHTPGHSAGEVCYWIQKNENSYLLTGDTVFIRDCGRTDLPTGNAAELFDSLQRIKTLPAHTIICPGHHYRPEYSSTLEIEMRTSPPFLCKTLDEFEALP